MIDEKFLEGIGITDKDTVQTQLDEASKTSPTRTWALTASDYKQKLEQHRIKDHI